MTPRARHGGFSLLETLVALTLLSIALLLGMALLLGQPRIAARLDGQRQATRALESTLESLRAGVIPLADARLTGFLTQAGDKPPDDLVVDLHVAPEGPPSLYRVSLTARYSLFGQLHRRRVETLLWQP
jgi:prepilin-type N-terminal cleavage/methylation domain-containing protein